MALSRSPAEGTCRGMDGTVIFLKTKCPNDVRVQSVLPVLLLKLKKKRITSGDVVTGRGPPRASWGPRSRSGSLPGGCSWTNLFKSIVLHT